MILVRQNNEKQRYTYKLDDRYRKVWTNIDSTWIIKHVELLDKVNHGYVLDYGNNYIDYKILNGIPASTFKHDTEFINRIYRFCLSNIEQTKPYAHGDWALSNILIDNDNIVMCDWDNLGIYPESMVIEKLHSDLTECFGVSFLKLIE